MDFNKTFTIISQTFDYWINQDERKALIFITKEAVDMLKDLIERNNVRSMFDSFGLVQDIFESPYENHNGNICAFHIDDDSVDMSNITSMNEPVQIYFDEDMRRLIFIN
jgi:hypothetical protein